MARTNTLIDAATLASLKTQVDAFFLLLLDAVVQEFLYEVIDEDSTGAQTFRVLIQVQSGGAVMSAPYTLDTFTGSNANKAMDAFNTYVAATPGSFISQPFHVPILAGRRRTRYNPIVAVETTDATNGATNWQIGGGGGGSGGGALLAGDVSGPLLTNILFAGELTAAPAAVLTVLDSVPAATYKTVFWAFEAVKGVNTYSSQINASHDGTTAVWVEALPVLAPGIGTFDFANSVDISAGLMRLLTTPATGGWSFRVRQLTLLTS